MEEKLNKILEMQEDQSKSLARLETSIMGDHEAGVKGLAKRVGITEKYIEHDKKFKAKVLGGFGVLTLVWGAILKFWDKIVS